MVYNVMNQYHLYLNRKGILAKELDDCEKIELCSDSKAYIPNSHRLKIQEHNSVV